jgi:dihydroorotate dehydrogenase (fumarate)
MASIGTLFISPALINTSCAWAGESHELDALFASPHTGAVTIRTATMDGFKEDETHTVQTLI